MIRNWLGRILHFVAFIGPGGDSLRPWLHRLRGANIGKRVWIARYVYVDELHPEEVTIGDNCTIGLRTSIFTHFYWGAKQDRSSGRVVIENNVFVGPHCVILPNVKIGQGAVIKAGTVVSRNIPPRTFWGSPSAKALGLVTVPLTAEHTYEEFVQGMRLRTKAKPRGSDSDDEIS